MTVLAACSAALAGWLLVGPGRGRLVIRPAAATVRPARPDARARVRAAVLVIAVLGLAVTLTLLVGPRAGALVAALGVAGLTVGHLAVGHVSAGVVRRRRREVARAASGLAVQLQAGLVATDALQNAATDWEVLRHGAAAQLLGADPTAVWQEQSRSAGLHGLADLARGWRLCLRTGAPLAPTLEQIAEALEAEEALGLTIAAELSAPRATGRIMAVLPLVGIGLGFAMGGDPVHFLLDSTPGRLCLVAGAGLAAAGIWWIERIAGRVAGQL